MTELGKNYDSADAEQKWQKYWEENRIFAFDEASEADIYSIDTPPPYASADHLHVGHGMHYSQFEFVARFQRMRGKNVFFPMGYDDNGLPTERYVEKKHNIDKSRISRADFIKLCLEETEKTGKTYYDLFTRLGFSVDWNLLYHTIGDNARRVAQKSFIDLYKKGRIQRTDYPTTWCTTCQTTIAQADFDNIDISSSFNDIIFKSGKEDLVISTTRPELLPACVAVFCHPDDPRYSHLKGKQAKIPLFDYEVPVLSDEKVEKEKGTGLMMVCTFGDKDDIEKWNKYKLGLRVILNEDGTLNKLAGKYAGMKAKDARKAMISDLKDNGLLVSQKDIMHAVNVHERCGTEIEFLKKQQWQIRILDKKDELIKIADDVTWYPEHMKVRYTHWVKNLQWNWGISRQRYYGVPFPVWFCKKCGNILLPEESELPVDPREEKYSRKCTCGCLEAEPEMDVMDTWMTSSCTPQINSEWGGTNERKRLSPMSLRPQAHDIIRTWAFYTLVKSYYHFNSIPWKDIMISGHGQDPHGQKMSKSKGNFIVAQDVIKKYSADAFRFWAASVRLGDDLPFQEKDVATGQKTVTKLFNASKFVLMHLADFDQSKKPKLTVIDTWIISKFNKIVKISTDAFEKYEYSKTKSETDNFFWNTFCDYYLEMAKDRLYNPDTHEKGARESAQYTLHHLLNGIIKLFAPIIPHITEEVYQACFAQQEGKKSIHLSRWPEHDPLLNDEKAEAAGELAVLIISEVRKFKAKEQISIKADIGEIVIECPKDKEEVITSVQRDILSTTKAKVIRFGAADTEVASGIKIHITA